MSPRVAKAVGGRGHADPAIALRDHLIDTAERVLGERNVSAVTIRDIASAGGVSNGVVYNYFADKNELLLAALVRRYSRLVDRYDLAMPTPGSGVVRENLLSFAEAALQLVTAALPIAAGLLSEPPLLSAYIDAIHTEPHGPQRLFRPLVEYLTGEQQLGRMAAVDIEAAVHLLFGPVIMISFASLITGAPAEGLAARLPTIVDTLLGGLAPR